MEKTLNVDSKKLPTVERLIELLKELPPETVPVFPVKSAAGHWITVPVTKIEFTESKTLNSKEVVLS